MTTALDRLQMIDTIRRFPGELSELVKSLSKNQLDIPTGAGEWTPRQVIHHLADSHMNAFIRARLILTEDNPTLKPYNQEAWALLADMQLPPKVSVKILKGLHERWAVFFESVKEEDWERTAIHPEIGQITLVILLETYARHCEEHLEQIKRVKKF
jgi:hypothetical protein